jgi:hypothetical protein
MLQQTPLIIGKLLKEISAAFKPSHINQFRAEI